MKQNGRLPPLSIAALVLLLASGPSQAGGLKSLVKGLGRIVGGALKLAAGGRSRAEPAGTIFSPSSLGPTMLASDWQDSPGLSQVCFYVQGGVDRLLLKTPTGALLRIPVPFSSSRRGSRMALHLNPGEYAWVGYEWEDSYTHSTVKEKKTLNHTTLCIWREERAFSLPFTVLPGKRLYGGTLEIEVLSTQGGGPSGLRYDSCRLMPPGSSAHRARMYGDRTLASREASRLLRCPIDFEVSPGAARNWVERDRESQEFSGLEEFERYQRWLERFHRLPHPQTWPIGHTGGVGVSFRLGMFESWTGWVARQPRHRRRRLSMETWLQQAGNQEAGRLLEARSQKARIRAVFQARRERQAAKVRTQLEERRASQWGKRDS